MHPSVPFDDFAKRPVRSWRQDGLPDLLLGMMLVVPGGIFLGGEALTKGGAAGQAYLFAAPWVWLGCVLALVWTFKRLKERITFPRAGLCGVAGSNLEISGSRGGERSSSWQWAGLSMAALELAFRSGGRTNDGCRTADGRVSVPAITNAVARPCCAAAGCRDLPGQDGNGRRSVGAGGIGNRDESDRGVEAAELLESQPETRGDMSPSASLDDFAKRPMRYWRQDGVVDLIVGLACMVTGIINLGGQALPRTSFVRVVTGFVAFGCFIALVRLIKPLKERITFPRTGYVAFRVDPPTWRFRTVVQVCTILFGLGLLCLPHASWFPGLFFALLMAAALAVDGLQHEQPHRLWLAVVTLFLGAACYALHTGIDGFHWVMTGLGVAMALTGAWRLHSFLKSNPKPEEPAA